MDKYEKMKVLDQDIQHLQLDLINQRAKLVKINKDTVYPLWKEQEDRCNQLEETIGKKQKEYEGLLSTLQYSLF